MTDIDIPKKNYGPVLISLFCVGIIIFILFTQCEVSNIKLKAKDASLVLIFLALLAYINNYQFLFLLLLGVFIFIYFAPNELINKLFAPFIKTKPMKSIIKKPKENIEIETPELTTDNEITLDTDIEMEEMPESIIVFDDAEDNKELAGPEEDIYLEAKKKTE